MLTAAWSGWLVSCGTETSMPSCSIRRCIRTSSDKESVLGLFAWQSTWAGSDGSSGRTLTTSLTLSGSMLSAGPADLKPGRDILPGQHLTAVRLSGSRGRSYMRVFGLNQKRAGRPRCPPALNGTHL